LKNCPDASDGGNAAGDHPPDLDELDERWPIGEDSVPEGPLVVEIGSPRVAAEHPRLAGPQ
jgi:hypothetical protein